MTENEGGSVHAFSKLIWLWIALSSFSLFQPAPYDMLFVVCLISAALLSFISIPRSAVLPAVLISCFINANLFSMLVMTGDITKASLFFFITLYLVGTWIFFIGILQRFHLVLMDVIFSGYSAAALIAVTIGLLAYFRVIPHAELFLYYDRMAGTFDDANIFGPFLVPAVLYALYKFEEKHSIAWLFMITFFSVGVLLSFSRAAWGNYFISILTYSIISTGKLKEKLNMILIMIFLITVVLFTINQSQVSSMLDQRLGYQSYDDHRFGTQLSSLQLAFDHPLGIGPRQTEPMLNLSTHNLYVRVITEYGIIGIFSFMGFLLLTLGRSLWHNFTSNKSYCYAAIVTATLVGILFNSFFIDTLHWRHFWMFLALPWIPLESGFKDEDRSSSNQIG